MSVAAVLLAAALFLWPGAAVVRGRAGLPTARPRPVHRAAHPTDPLATASTLDVMSVCLSAGMSVPAAAAATFSSAPPGLASLLRRAADLLALGAEPDTAWATADGADASSEALARLARRSAASGSALARGVADLAEQSRQEATHTAAAAAERASVLIAGPLGLCFLPAFICLGIVPVVAGLAADVFGSGLL
jgi:pilus assembly protein TadC